MRSVTATLRNIAGVTCGSKNIISASYPTLPNLPLVPNPSQRFQTTSVIFCIYVFKRLRGERVKYLG